MNNPTLWNQILVWPILNLLIAIYKILSLIGIPGAFGFAIVILTVIIRGATLPLSHTQLKSAKKIQDLKPRLDELTQKHGKDKVKLQQAQLALYKEAGVNPAAGCLPLLLQMPVFIALYNVFIQVLNKDTGVVIETINKILYHPALHIEKLDLSFLGTNLSARPNEWQSAGVWLLTIPFITGGLQYLQTRLMTKTTNPPSQKSQEDQATAMQRQMALMMPVMIGFFSLSFPLGLSLYWNIFTLFGIIQQLQINKTTRI